MRLLALLLCLLPLLARAELPESIQRALKAANIPPSSVGLWVAPATGGAPLIQHNADKALNPASVMKLVTTSAALDVLGPAYTWSTEAYLGGPLSNGVLVGDLVLRGSGDPSLSWDKLGQFLRELRGRGIQDIRGDLVLDRSLFAGLPPANGNFDDQPLRAYNAQPDALLVNFKALTLRLTPSAQGIEAVAMTPYAPLIIDNQLRIITTPCSDWRNGFTTELESVGEGLRVRLKGNLSASCGERLLHLAVQDGPRFAAGIFRALWSELGGTWQGRVREGTMPTGVQPYAIWKSPPLSDIVRDINKFSNNVMARQLFLTLGTRSGDAGSSISPTSAASPQQATATIRDWLRQNRVDMPELVLENGSGLSRIERATAGGLGRLLQQQWQSPRMPILVSSLPVAGSDGTARRRFSERAVSGRAYLKTGSLNDVMAHAGYVQDAQARWYVLVWIINDPNAGAGEAATTLSTDWVFEQAGARASCCQSGERSPGAERRGR